jgi:hypothetical protein
MDTKISNNNQLYWKVTIVSGSNKITTDGKAAINGPVTPAVTPAVTPVVTPMSSPVCTVTDKNKHIEEIKGMLNECENTKGKENKAKIAIRILNYVINEAVDFTKSYPHFKETVINKCYEFKQLNSDMPDIVDKSNEVLVKFGASTTIPADFKGRRGSNTTTSVPTVKTDSSTVKKDNTQNADLAIFKALANKYNHKTAIANPTIYLAYFEHSVQWGSVTGTTRADKMVNYFSKYSEDGQRASLMKTIFTKHNLIFSDAAMTLYNEWVKTYTPTDRTNRYKKMTEFATVHKSLFTA